MKASKKADRVVEEVVKTASKKKKTEKPWILEEMIVDPKRMDEHSWWVQIEKKKLNVWYKDAWQKFISLEHALRELNKQARSHNWRLEPINNHWRFAGKEFRLVNVDTQEVVPLVLGEREIHVKREERADSGGSSEGNTET